MNILILGGNSQIALNIRHLFSEYPISLFYTFKNKTDCVDKYSCHLNLEMVEHHLQGFKDFIESNNISCALIAAGITSQATCQLSPVKTLNVNVKAVELIFHVLHQSNVFIVYISSNTIFNGKAPLAKVCDIPNPQSQYGLQKALCESYLRLNFPESAFSILRLTKVLSSKSGILMDWRNAIKDQKKISAFSNMSFAPVHLDDVSKIIVTLLTAKLCGIYQYSASSDITYFEAAQVLFELSDAGHLLEKKTWQESGRISFHVPCSTSLCSNIHYINPIFKSRDPLALLISLWEKMG